MEFTSFDGEKIWYKVWAAESPRAVIQIMTGLAEVADYYEIFAPEMVKAGYTVALHPFSKLCKRWLVLLRDPSQVLPRTSRCPVCPQSRYHCLADRDL